ncbi:alpha/beta hydrolase [Brasilonema octagenarum]|uniref:alpha/beta hydrolase n=1 Tax=Brasilonema octagenarum TaxID=417105 RepID=UPI001B7CE606|nr:alpha/beta hydrolase [Brasilonema octagenarum]
MLKSNAFSTKESAFEIARSLPNQQRHEAIVAKQWRETMQSDSKKLKHNNADAVEIRHPLTEKDGETVAVMRTEAASSKGKLRGSDARGAFDEIQEKTPDASGVSYEQGTVGGVPGVWCHPQNPRPGVAILYLHGGAYVQGSAHAYRHLAGQVAVRTSVSTFVADYRLAPEHPFPAALDDAKAAYRGLVKQGTQKIAIVGDSAGGGLALVLLAIAQSDALARGSVAPSAAVVMSPWTDLALTGLSLQDHADDDPLLTREVLSMASASYLNGHEPNDPLVSPLYGSFTDLPSIQIHVGTSEVLLDDTRRYAKRAHAEEVDVTAHVWEGMTHVFPGNVGTLNAAEAALGMIATFLKSKTNP